MKFNHELSEKEKYSDGSLHYSTPLRPWHLHQVARFHAVAEALENVPVKSLLDVGCGYGDFFYYLATKHVMLERYSAIDLNPMFVGATAGKLSTDGFSKCSAISKPRPCWTTALTQRLISTMQLFA